MNSETEKKSEVMKAKSPKISPIYIMEIQGNSTVGRTTLSIMKKVNGKRIK